MSKFPDCESCTFNHSEQYICDNCNEADQWEPSDPMDAIQNAPRAGSIARKFHKMKREKYKEAA